MLNGLQKHFCVRIYFLPFQPQFLINIMYDEMMEKARDTARDAAYLMIIHRA